MGIAPVAPPLEVDQVPGDRERVDAEAVDAKRVCRMLGVATSSSGAHGGNVDQQVARGHQADQGPADGLVLAGDRRDHDGAPPPRSFSE
jgi:hypothetical protein